MSEDRQSEELSLLIRSSPPEIVADDSHMHRSPSSPSPTGRKRSHGEIDETEASKHESGSEHDLRASGRDLVSKLQQAKRERQVHDMLPPAVPASQFKMPQSSAPTSAQKSAASAASSQDYEAATKPTGVYDPFNSKDQPTGSAQPEGHTDVDGPESGPDEALPAYDWTSLEERVDAELAKQSTKQQDLFNEFHQLSDFFFEWANAAAAKDDGRSNQRFEARRDFVKTEEDSVEAKRQHYIQVVNAFQQALHLLGS